MEVYNAELVTWRAALPIRIGICNVNEYETLHFIFIFYLNKQIFCVSPRQHVLSSQQVDI